MLNQIKSYYGLAGCLFVFICYSSEIPKNKRKLNEVGQILHASVSQKNYELAAQAKRPCKETRSKADAIESDIEYLLDVQRKQERDHSESIESYFKLQRIFWKPHNLPLLQYALDKKIIRVDSKILHPGSFFKIPYEEGFKALRAANSNNYFGDIHLLRMAVLSNSLLLVNRHMKENPEEDDVDDAMIEAASARNFPLINALLYHGADPFLQDVDGTSVVDFMMDKYLEDGDEKAHHVADVLEHAHWRRIKRLAELLLQSPAFNGIQLRLPICLRIAEFRYGHKLTPDEIQHILDEGKH